MQEVSPSFFQLMTHTYIRKLICYNSCVFTLGTLVLRYFPPPKAHYIALLFAPVWSVQLRRNFILPHIPYSRAAGTAS